jgi:hypothetical protein
MPLKTMVAALVGILHGESLTMIVDQNYLEDAKVG